MKSSSGRFLDTTWLPDPSLPEMYFWESSFFRGTCDGEPSDGEPTRKLPTPAAVLAKTKDIRGIVKFEELNLLVKFGHRAQLRTEEALTTLAIRRAFPNGEVPVPELYGWTCSGDKIFLYMSLVQGSTLRDRWSSLTEDDRTAVCDQLCQIVRAIRRLQQCSPEPFIGSIVKGHVQDIYFRFSHEAGPFPTVKAFNDWVQYAALQIPMAERPPEPYRDLLSDDADICFTHGDLNLGNIMIDGAPGAVTISAILDWEQAGWYPAYWEYCKSLIAVPYNHEWRAFGWADRVMYCYEDEWIAFSEYWTWRRP